jgi:ActR/RegA family two-component response regulator
MIAEKEKVLVVTTDLFFLPRVQNVATPNGYATRQVMTIERLQEELSEGVSILALVDLEGDSDFWSEAVKTLVDFTEQRPKIVGYGGHTNIKMLDRAKKLGCDLVLTKGQFSRDLQKLISSQGSEVGEPVTDHMR